MANKFDRNLIVIGAGSAGLVTAYISAAIKSKVTLIEKHKMGGDCLNYGCVPSKALIRSARMCADMRRADKYSIHPHEPEFDFEKIMQRIQSIIKTIEPHDSVERYTSLGVECLTGEAKIVSPHSVEINGQTLSARRLVVATGARPFVPPIDGIDSIKALTSDNIWDLKQLPKRLTVLGGGPIGCELAQCFARFGAQVTLVEMAPGIMIKDDPQAAAIVHQSLEEDGVNILTQHKAVQISNNNDQKQLICESGNDSVAISFDEILVAVGRRANTENLGLEAIGVELNKNGTIKTDDRLLSTVPSILACGDVTGPYQFTHTASHQAWYASVNGLFDKFKTFKVDYSVIPWVTYTQPEVAQVGLTQSMAEQKGLEFEVTRYDFSGFDRALTESATTGFVKVITRKGKDTILGATIVGDHAGEMITEFTLAMKHDLGLNKILGTIHPYPTWMEANKFAAGAWKREHAPQWALKLLKKFHQWRL